MKDAILLIFALLCLIGVGVGVGFLMHYDAVRTILCAERGGVYINQYPGFCVKRDALIDMEAK